MCKLLTKVYHRKDCQSDAKLSYELFIWFFAPLSKKFCILGLIFIFTEKLLILFYFFEKLKIEMYVRILLFMRKWK